MGEGKTSMFGKTYNTIGSTDSNFIIKTKGDLKIQWGNKFIDVIKNGKLASKDSSLLKLVSSKDDIKGDGIYILEDGTVCISIKDTIVDLLGNTGVTYVSFLEKQETTPELKYLALLNIGFVYNTLKEAEEASLLSGIIYVTEKNKLYIIIDGKILEYLVNFESEKEQEEEALTELVIGDLKIYNDAGYSKLNSATRILLLINDSPYISLELNLVKIRKNLVIDNDFYILSTDASDKKGFRLYLSNGKSTLEVDDIVWRNIDKELPVNRLTEGIIYSKYDNVVTKITTETSTTLVAPTGEVIPLYVYLKYKNLYLIGLFVYFYPKTLLVVKLEQISNKVTVFLENSRTCEEDITVLITYDDSKTASLTILAGNNSVESSLAYKVINGISIVTAPKGVITQDDLNSKNTKLEFEIVNSLDEYITISVPVELLNTIISSSSDSLIHLSRDPYIEISNNNVLLIDRSKTVTVEGKEVPDETIHTNIGIIKENEIESLTKHPTEEADINALKEYETSVLVGIYSDNFIGLNSKLYDAVFKKRSDYPKYDQAIEIPKDFSDTKYDSIIPNINWIKLLLQLAVPKGTITMFNGQSDIPKGWAVCDGTNGTPNLIGKFIKAVATVDLVGENISNLNENNELTLTKEHLPEHNHPHKAHTHNLSGDGTTGNSGNLEVTLNYSDYNWGIESYTSSVITSVSGEGVTSESGYVNEVSNILTLGGTAIGGDHSHSISLNSDSGILVLSATSEEDTLEWTNKPIKIEPRSYSLIFIMKL